MSERFGVFDAVEIASPVNPFRRREAEADTLVAERPRAFTVLTLWQPSDRSQVGKVVDEQPRGRNAPVRSVVTIYVGRSS